MSDRDYPHLSWGPHTAPYPSDTPLSPSAPLWPTQTIVVGLDLPTQALLRELIEALRGLGGKS
jgi:hypothetical protein